MNINELIKLLIYGELRNLSYVGSDGNIKADKLDRLIDTINLGLLDLYTRFYINRKTKEISIIKDQHEYKIDDDNLIEITSIGLDKSEYMFKAIDTIYLFETNKDKLTVIYKTKHNKITKDNLDMLLELPSSYLNALVLFVASRLYTSIPNQLDGDLHEHSRYVQRYVEEIKHLTDTGIDVDDLDDKWLFTIKGFV